MKDRDSAGKIRVRPSRRPRHWPLWSFLPLLAAAFVASRQGGSAETLPLQTPPRAGAAERPNILWIVSEDNGPQLGAYGDAYADTPNLDKLAARGYRYRVAWSNGPVCAAARTTIISGLYPESTAFAAHQLMKTCGISSSSVGNERRRSRRATLRRERDDETLTSFVSVLSAASDGRTERVHGVPAPRLIRGLLPEGARG